MFRPALRFTLALLLPLQSMQSGHSGESAKLEASYIVLDEQGMVARTILTNAAQCPTINLDGNSQQMNVRASPGGIERFPDLVCEFFIPAGTNIATINGQALPLLQPTLGSIAVLGDSGCRLRAVEFDPTDTDWDDGKFQNCNTDTQWPLSVLAKSAAAARPDLVIHVGDYLYRESPCPKNDHGCAGSPYGDNWTTWKADFFTPAAPLLQVAPWIMVRGNHEICKRAGTGYFRYLHPTLAQGQAALSCIDMVPFYTVKVGDQSFVILDSSDAADTCPKQRCKSAPYVEQFSNMSPAVGTWLVTHRPIWGLKNKNVRLNATLQAALARWDGRLPPGFTLVVAGHIHLWEVLSFADQRSPQFVLGNSGTSLAHKIKQPLIGQQIQNATISFGRSEHEWGYTLFRHGADETNWTATYYGINGDPKFSCRVSATAVSC